MRRPLTLGVIAVALVALPFAPIGAQSAQFGVAAGASLATLTGDLVDGTKNYSAFIAGAFARFDMSGFSIEPGIYYTGKGAKFEDEEEGFDATNKLAYVQVPVLVKVGFPMGSTSRFYVGAGPAIGFKVSCKLKASGGGFSASTDCEDLEDEDGGGLKAKSTEFSGIGVAGIEFGKFAVGIRADLGLTNVYEAFFDDVSLEPSIKTRTLSLMASIRL
ncbi:MAG: PorT family protein [Gemmatimonadales bacterium]|nr:PorT family protein [Gemmatimonadales bacterium]